MVAYLDTETLGEKWLATNISQIEIADLDTKVTRQITHVPAMYYTVAMNGKYLAWGEGSSTLFLCDLEKGGYINSSGHVIPAGAADAGVDSGPDASHDASLDANADSGHDACAG